jgi:hypothetical protein
MKRFKFNHHMRGFPLGWSGRMTACAGNEFTKKSWLWEYARAGRVGFIVGQVKFEWRNVVGVII